jgi:hypothetical protein
MKLPQPRRYKSGHMKFEDLIEFGENPNGFTAQTPNGTAHAFGTGWNQDTYTYTREQGPPTPVSPAGRSNRTAE